MENRNWAAARDFGRAPCNGVASRLPGGRAQAPSRPPKKPSGENPSSLRVCSAEDAHDQEFFSVLFTPFHSLSTTQFEQFALAPHEQPLPKTAA
jgi:hypothetical protein